MRRGSGERGHGGGGLPSSISVQCESGDTNVANPGEWRERISFCPRGISSPRRCSSSQVV